RLDESEGKSSTSYTSKKSKVSRGSRSSRTTRARPAGAVHSGELIRLIVKKSPTPNISSRALNAYSDVESDDGENRDDADRDEESEGQEDDIAGSDEDRY